MAGQAVGNYTIGRPLVGGLVCGIILGNLQLGIACGVAMQLVYIALVTPGGTVSADVRAISYIGIPLAMVAISSQGLNPLGGGAANLAKSVGTLVGTVGTVLYYAVATMNLVWQSFGWKDVHNGKLDKLTAVNLAGLGSHMHCSHFYQQCYSPTTVLRRLQLCVVPYQWTALP